MQRTIFAVLVVCAAVAGCRFSEGETKVDKATLAVPHLVGNVTVDRSGTWMAYSHEGDIWIRLVSGEGKPIDVTGVAEKSPFAPEGGAAVPVQMGAQAGWEFSPAWSPCGLMMAFAAARNDGDDDSGNDGDLDIWVARFADLDWNKLAELDVQLGGAADVDEKGENGLFWDDCPAAAEGVHETADQKAERLASCTRRLRPPTFVQMTSDPGQESDPVWVPRAMRIAFRSDKGGVWTVDVPADLRPTPEQMAAMMGGMHGEGGGPCGCGGNHGPGECPMHAGMNAPGGEPGGCPMHTGMNASGGPPAEGGCGCGGGMAMMHGGPPAQGGGCPMHAAMQAMPDAPPGEGTMPMPPAPPATDAPPAPPAPPAVPATPPVP